MRKQTGLRSLVGAVLAGFALSVAPVAVQAQVIEFDGLGDYAGNGWNGAATQIGAHQGFEFYGLHALNIPRYQDNWVPDPILNGYTTPTIQPLANTVALGTTGAFIQKAGAAPFFLRSLQMGSGWNAASLTFNGYQCLTGACTAQYTATHQVNATDHALSTFDFGWSNLTYFTIGVQWGDNDPFNSLALAIAAQPEDDEPAPVAPYRTFYINQMDVTEVPEPASIVLLAAGLAGLGIAARRRRSVR